MIHAYWPEAVDPVDHQSYLPSLWRYQEKGDTSLSVHDLCYILPRGKNEPDVTAHIRSYDVLRHWSMVGFDLRSTKLLAAAERGMAEDRGKYVYFCYFEDDGKVAGASGLTGRKGQGRARRRGSNPVFGGVLCILCCRHTSVVVLNRCCRSTGNYAIPPSPAFLSGLINGLACGSRAVGVGFPSSWFGRLLLRGNSDDTDSRPLRPPLHRGGRPLVPLLMYIRLSCPLDHSRIKDSIQQLSLYITSSLSLSKLAALLDPETCGGLTCCISLQASCGHGAGDCLAQTS